MDIPRKNERAHAGSFTLTATVYGVSCARFFAFQGAATNNLGSKSRRDQKRARTLHRFRFAVEFRSECGMRGRNVAAGRYIGSGSVKTSDGQNSFACSSALRKFPKSVSCIRIKKKSESL